MDYYGWNCRARDDIDEDCELTEPTEAVKRCECGAHALYGRDCGARMHSDWCPCAKEAE